MKTNQLQEKTQQLYFRELGRGFIVTSSTPGLPVGRRLVKTYADQLNRKYFLIEGRYEPLKPQHNFLAAE